MVVEEKSDNPINSTTRRDFAALIAPLELRAGARLGDPWRSRALCMFAANEAGVRAVVRGMLKNGGPAFQNPLGALCYRLGNGWHELEPLSPPSASGEQARPEDDCIDCGKRAALDRETFKCDDCRGVDWDAYTRA